MKGVLALLLGLLCVGVVASVETTLEEESYSSELFAKADSNGDGQLSLEEFQSLSAHLLPKGNMVPARIDPSMGEPTYRVNTPVFIETQAETTSETSRPKRRLRGHPGGCYRVCPSPVVFRNGEPFGGPFGPDPYYSYGNNHMY